MCCDTYASPSQRSLLHVPEQPRLLILLETTNDPSQSKMFHASKLREKLKTTKKQRSFRTFGKFKCLENSNVLRFIRCMQCFVFKTVEERCRSHNKRKQLPLKTNLKP